jgi:hypothetical protein
MASSPDRERRARDAVLELVSSRPGITIREITTQLSDVDDADVILRAMSDTDLVVSSPTALQVDPVDAMFDGALSREEAAQRIGSTPEDVSQRIVAGKLVGLRRGGDWRFPLWQFTGDGTLPALDELIAVWPGTLVSLSTWATAQSADLGGRTPAEELGRRGGPERVAELARALAESAW